MKVKVGFETFDGNVQPVMVVLTTQDKKNIANMPPENTKYCHYPDGQAEADVEAFMKTE